VTTKLMAWVVFSGDDDELDVDRAADELQRAGYNVLRMPDGYGGRLAHPLDDFIEAYTEGPDTYEVTGAMMDEINAIVDRHGGCCMEAGTIECDHVPFAGLFEKVPPRVQ
jgi:hypothetical protein